MSFFHKIQEGASSLLAKATDKKVLDDLASLTKTKVDSLAAAIVSPVSEDAKTLEDRQAASQHALDKLAAAALALEQIPLAPESFESRFKHIEQVCFCLEQVFLQGMKRSNVAALFRVDDGEPWSVLLKAAEIHPTTLGASVSALKSLQRVSTSRGRFRAWVRSCMNKKSLNILVEDLIQDQELLA
jgi:hypothetical protein